MTERAPEVVLAERAPHLAFLATEAMYAAQPELWDRGEKGRFHTLDDFTMHFRAVANGESAFRAHVAYCYRLFEERGFPRRWLDDAWRFMRAVAEEDLEGEPLAVFIARLASGTEEVA